MNNCVKFNSQPAITDLLSYVLTTFTRTTLIFILRYWEILDIFYPIIIINTEASGI